MIDRHDLLTWQTIRGLGDCEAIAVPDGQVLLAPTDPRDRAHGQLRIRERAEQRITLARSPVSFAAPASITPRRGGLVYARVAWRHPWRDTLRAQLPADTVLLTSFHDSSIKDIAATAWLEKDSPVAHWYGVQVVTTHPRVTPMPVGVEPVMEPILRAADRRDYGDRDIPLYLNFNLRHARAPQVNALRGVLWQHFASRSWVVAEHWGQHPAHYAAQLGRSRFVLSPRGWAWDCYRAYDAIAMGAIPIVMRQDPQTRVCDGLPIWVVDSWNEVTPEAMDRVWPDLRGRSPARATASYWTAAIRQQRAQVCA